MPDGKPVAEVFTKTPGQVFTDSRTQYAGENPTHRPTQSGVACPLCEKNDPPDLQVPVTPRGSGSGFQCRNGHTFADNDSLMSYSPRFIPTKPQVARQEGYEQLNLQIPSSLRKALQDRFGDKLADTIASVLWNISEAKTLMINAMDAARLSSKLGEDARSGQHLVGMMIQKTEALQEALNKIEALERAASQRRESGQSGPVPQGDKMPLGWVKVDLSEQYEALMKLSYGRGQPIEEVVRDAIRTGVDNRWI